MPRFSRTRVPGITALQWQRLTPLLQLEGTSIEPAQLCSTTGMDIDSAYLLVLNVFHDQLADLFMLVMHSCREHPVAVRTYAEGFQPVPWFCPECEEEIRTQSELRYELRAVLRSQIRIT